MLSEFVQSEPLVGSREPGIRRHETTSFVAARRCVTDAKLALAESSPSDAPALLCVEMVVSLTS